MTSQTPEETPRKDFGFEPKHPDGLPNIEKDCTTDCPWCDGYPPCEYRIGYNDGFNTLHPQLQKAHLRGYRLAVKHLKEAYTANGATTVPEAIEWLEDNLRLYRDELDQDTDNDCPKHGNSEVAKQLFWEKPLTSHWGCRCKSELDQEVGITSEDKK